MSVAIFTGGDESILRDAVSVHVDELVRDGDRSLMVDDFDDPEYELADLVAAANTPPLLTEWRIVIGRDVGRFTADELRPLVAYLEAPSDTTALVLVAGSGRLPKAMTDAVARVGGTSVNTTPPARPRDRQQWVDEQASGHGVSLSRDAAARIGDHLGEDVGVLAGSTSTTSNRSSANAAASRRGT